LGPAVNKDLRGGMDDRFVGAACDSTNIRSAISVVVAGNLQYRTNYTSIAVYFLQIIQGNGAGRLP
jgi:hypothetical protein